MRGSQKLSGTVNYRFLYLGQVVSRQPGRSFTHGVCYDTLKWPRKAVGHTITLQVVVSTRYGTDYLNWCLKKCNKLTDYQRGCIEDELERRRSADEQVIPHRIQE